MKFAAALVCATVALAQQGTIESNVIYGMYSGAALLLDVHKPAKSNGRGVIFISGSGWQAPLGYGAPPLKGQQIPEWRGALLDAGFTVFAITHRAAPRFAYPAAIDDVQRAIRFVRHNAARYGIDPNRIGGIGGSSGGHLIALAAMRQAPGDASSSDAVDREPATLQCAVLRAAPTDMTKMFGANTVATAAVVSFVGAVPTTPEAQKMFRVASPVSYVTSSGPPVLLLHGDADETVPFEQSVAFEKLLQAQNVPVKLIRVPGGVHGHVFTSTGSPHADFPKILSATTAWLNQYLVAAK